MSAAQGKDAVPETVFHLIIPIDPAVDMSWIGVSGVPVDGVHASDRIRPTRGGGTFSELELSQGVKLLKPAMLVSLVDTLKMDQCLIFCRTNVDCDNLEVVVFSVYSALKGRFPRSFCVAVPLWPEVLDCPGWRPWFHWENGKRQRKQVLLLCACWFPVDAGAAGESKGVS